MGWPTAAPVDLSCLTAFLTIPEIRLFGRSDVMVLCTFTLFKASVRAAIFSGTSSFVFSSMSMPNPSKVASQSDYFFFEVAAVSAVAPPIGQNRMSNELAGHEGLASKLRRAAKRLRLGISKAWRFRDMPLKVHSDPCFHHNVPAGATLLSTQVRGVLLARPNGMVDGLLNGLAIAKAFDRS